MRDASHLFGDPRLPDRVWEKIEVKPCGCWHWTRATNDRGYAIMAPLREGPAAGERRVVRAVYKALVGPISLTLDHECHDPKLCAGLGDACPHRACVNPLDVVERTQRDNMLRGGTIQAANVAKLVDQYGHEFDGETTGATGLPVRTCSICARARKRAYKRTQRGLPAVPLTDLMYPVRKGGRPRKNALVTVS